MFQLNSRLVQQQQQQQTVQAISRQSSHDSLPTEEDRVVHRVCCTAKFLLYFYFYFFNFCLLYSRCRHFLIKARNQLPQNLDLFFFSRNSYSASFSFLKDFYFYQKSHEYKSQFTLKCCLFTIVFTSIRIFPIYWLTLS